MNKNEPGGFPVDQRQHVLRLVLGMILTVLIGSYGYVLIENWSFFDGLYMTIITMATIGYGETHELSSLGRAYTLFLIFIGCGMMAYGFSTLTAYTVGGDFSRALRRIQMNKAIQLLRGHFVICGDGDVGQFAIEELIRTHRQFVVVERDAKKIAKLRERGILHIAGDATTDPVLLAAGIEHARGLITALHSDSDNLFVVLTARTLNQKLRIVSKCISEENQGKIRKAGADSVVLPEFIGGLRLVSDMIRPSVVSFLDQMLRDKDRTMRVEEIGILDGSPLAGQNLSQTGILEQNDFSVIALMRPDQPYLFNPSPSTRLEEGDRLIVIGWSLSIEQFNRSLLTHATT